MAETALRNRLPTRQQVGARLLTAAAVGATLFVLDGSIQFAAASAVGFLGLTLAGDTAEAAVGDYASNVVLGLVVLGFTVAFLRSWPLGAAAGALVGGWLVVDGVQHRRHGATREDVTIPYDHDGSPVTGLPRALLARLVEPFRL